MCSIQENAVICPEHTDCNMADKLKKVCVLGHFGAGKNLLNGQTIKTKIITEELENQLGETDVLKIDTSGGKKTLAKVPFQVFSALKSAKNVIIFPAHNGVRIYVPFFVAFGRLFKHAKLHYVVIGGWLPQFLAKRERLAEMLKKFDGIYVETNTMKSALEKQGFRNIYVMPNCKKLTVLSENELVYPDNVPYRLCTFSRVIKEKGIETAVDVVKSINGKLGYTAYSLDIYGPIEPTQTEWFENLQKTFPDYIHYRGSADADKSVDILKDYFALLFPTRYYTEGIPGTIIDAYAAGIPVISARWESCADIVDEGKTGFVYDFENAGQFEEILLKIVDNPGIAADMKSNCLTKAKEYMPETAIQKLELGGVKSTHISSAHSHVL